MTQPSSPSDTLHERVRAFIQASIAPSRVCESFDRLALALASFQAEHVPAIARLVSARGVRLADLANADAIPAVPCDAFRFARIAAHPAYEDAAVFRTSGTTAGT